MGKASRWFRTFLGLKQPDPNPSPNPKLHKEKQRKWTFVKSSTTLNTRQPPPPPPSPPSPPPPAQCSNNLDAPTSSSYDAGGNDTVHVIRDVRELELQCAVVVIQSYFRGYLARRALRALQGLVKLQALVRGHIVRIKTAEAIRCMQAMLRAQARARSVRAYIPESPYASTTKSCPISYPGPPTPEKFEHMNRTKSMQQNHSPKINRFKSMSSSGLNTTMSQVRTNFGSSWSDPPTANPMWDPWGVTSSTRSHDDRGDKILKIDTGKHLRSRSRLFETSYSGLLTSKDYTTHHSTQLPLSCEGVEIDNNSYCRAENRHPYCSPVSQGGNSTKGTLTPAKSDGCRSLLSGYSDCPSYMSYTESAKAKLRSLSAPKQRPQFERKNSTKMYLVQEGGEHYPRSNAHRVSSMHASFASKGYLGPDRLDKLGMPLMDSRVVYYSGYLN